MLCDWLGVRFDDSRLTQSAERIEVAVAQHLAEGRPITFDLGGEARCSEVGDLLVQALA